MQGSGHSRVSIFMEMFLKLRRSVRLGRRQEGSAAVEFALVLPVLLMMLGGIIDMGNLYYIKSTASEAAEMGARLAAVKQFDLVVPTIQGTYDDQYQVSITPASFSAKGTVTVQVTVPVTFFFPMISVFFPSNPTVTGKCVMYMENL